MKKYLLPESGNFYKANLHCHTNLSDGHKTPEEVKELYLKKGYSIVAYTDHDVYLTHNDLTDDKFLALNGFEAEVMNRHGRRHLREVKRCDICYIALDPDNDMHPIWHRTKYLFGNAVNYRDMVKFDESERDYLRTYTPEAISDMMQTGREKGFFVTLNHPTWSRETYDYYSKYEGLHALELFNGGCINCGYEDYNPRVYDDILRTGKKIYAIGGDDNHNADPDDSRRSDSGHAWTTIKAEKLDYRTITKAMEAGHFYASEGPEIHELYMEDGQVHIKCSPADMVFVTYQMRGCASKLAEHGEMVTEAVFNINPDMGYFRITVKDERGKLACTNAYFPEDYM